MPSTRDDVPAQAAAIALRQIKGALEVCLIRKKDSRRWGIPKGFVDDGDTHEETALNEAWEEAGLKGRLVGGPLGTYEYAKWYTTLVVAVYVMDVREQLSDWDEATIRERRWVAFDKAVLLLGDHPVSPLLVPAKTRLIGGA